MKRKLISILLALIFVFSLASGCGKKSGQSGTPTQIPSPTNTSGTSPSPTSTSGNSQDVTTSASIVQDAAAFQKAISNNGTWIIAITKDLTVNSDLVLDGEFKNGKKDSAGKDIIQRKIALYAQDANRNITARYTLTAPKITINSPMASIQHGTFKGDVYVTAKNFQLVDQKIDGNLYFTNNDAKTTFKMDATSSVTGKQELLK